MDDDGSISFEELKTRLAVRMVGTMAIRGDSYAAIRAEYPNVLDEDIEVARRLVASSDPLLTVVDASRFRHRDAGKPIAISEFDRWLNDNNIPETFEYSNGWWAYVEFIRVVCLAAGRGDGSRHRPLRRQHSATMRAASDAGRC